MASERLRLWAVSSGWDGPFQHEEVIVVAVDAVAARRAAEGVFETVVQPVCRARMRIADLGEVRDGAVSPARRGGEAFARDGVPAEIACGE